jgi:hypothetical protein
MARVWEPKFIVYVAAQIEFHKAKKVEPSDSERLYLKEYHIDAYDSLDKPK